MELLNQYVKKPSAVNFHFIKWQKKSLCRRAVVVNFFG
jgi:hypothetical protein